MNLTVPVCYAPESVTEYESFEVESLPVLSERRPAQIDIPHGTMHFNISGIETSFSNCQKFGPLFNSCHVNDVNLAITDCLFQLIHQTKFEARQVIEKTDS